MTADERRIPVAQPRSAREVFLALVNVIADGDLDEVPGLYAEQVDVVHPFDPLRGAPLRSRDELRSASATARSSAPATITTISPRPGSGAGSANSSPPSARGMTQSRLSRDGTSAVFPP